jgi:pimeloyl-ACP methyl ester carboxylesterase
MFLLPVWDSTFDGMVGKARFMVLKTLGVFFILIVYSGLSCRGQQKSPDDSLITKLGKGFVSDTAGVNGTTIHYVRGGTGPVVILVHGFPEDWYEWHTIMPRLSKKFTVVAIDLRGIGGSKATPAGYEKANMAEDIHQLIVRLKLEHVYVVGHDIGGMVAYAFLRSHPEETRGTMIIDVGLPGISPWEEDKVNPVLWHFGFHQMPKLPEQLIAGRQFIYFREAFFDRFSLNNKAITDDEVTHDANSYGTPEQLRAGLELYRAFPADEKFNAAQQSRLEVPIVLAGADHSVAPNLPRIAESLRKNGCASVTIEVIAKSGHYVAEEQPEVVAGLIERYASL